MLKISSFSNIFANRNFLKLWLSQVLSQPAGNMLGFILAIRVYETTGSNFLVSALIALVSIPPILFSSTAGVLADSINRKTILVFSNLLRGILVIGLIFFGDSYLAILVLAFLMSAVTVFFTPSETASIPTLTKKENLFTANTLFLFTLYASFLVGYSLAGPLLFWLGDNIYFLLILAFFLAAFMDILLPPLDHHLREREEIKKNIKQSFRIVWKKLKEGIFYIKNNSLVLLTVLQIAFVFSIERAVIALVPDFAINLLHFDLSQIGYFLIMPVGLGALMGAVVANRLKVKFSKRKIITAGILIDAFTLALLPLYEIIEKHAVDFSFSAGFFWSLTCYVMILAFLSGMADVAIIISAQTMLQEETHQEKRGRVFGNVTMLMNLVGLPLVLLVGFLASIYPVAKIILSLGIVTFLVGIISWRVNVKKLDPMFNTDSETSS